MHLVTAPSPADRKTKYILSGRTGAFIRRILEDKKLLALSYITSVVKCGTYQTVDSKAIIKCFPRLQKEIARVEPSMFITYGKDPYFIISGGKKLPKNGEGIDMLPNGKSAKFLDDQKTYLGNQLESEFGSERCFGVLADMDFILICTYEEQGKNPELVLYKKR